MNFLQADTRTASAGLTEFEGALLAEIARLQPCTAYQLRRTFLTSPSRSWSGSAGAVYPAVRRLTGAGLIAAELAEGDTRGGSRLSLTQAGERARVQWVCDPERAVDSGFDPFRTRATLLESVPAAEREAFLGVLRRQLRARIAWLDRFAADEDAVNQARAAMDAAQQRFRLAWLDERFPGQP